MGDYKLNPIKRESVISKAAEELCRYIEAPQGAPLHQFQLMMAHSQGVIRQ